MADSVNTINRVIISGGGTGGHIHPALAIADEIKRRHPECDVLFVGAQGRMEMEKIPAAGYAIKGLWITGLDRNWRSLRNWIFPFKLIHSLWNARRILSRFKPQLVVGVGGFASGPVLYQAVKMGIPSAIQEQNSFPGITNRLLAKKVCLICAGFPGMERWFPANRIVETGNPLRMQVLDAVSDQGRCFESAWKHFEFDGSRPVVFVMGGSLGAASMNAAVCRMVEKSSGALPFDLIWQTGTRYYDEMCKRMQAWPGPIKTGIRCFGFIDRMDLAYTCATLIASRAGAMSIAELALVGKPTILVPSPVVAEDHQTKNARSLSDRNGAILIPDSEVVGRLDIAISELLSDSDRAKSLQMNLLHAARPEAAKDVVSELEKLL
ncbi:MAG TPA: UDP-N-acetylglucosamine--N-acetylmuramyl-(pentapeptide) pyrophosphoryl-undecaprenol N-acetylglucosamine transferase [Flavobacteriales bacterium]|nr:UDP-N-acetylglucosamine--N-acetylmuramyl-(pentapeptide) pyrophosphoryl-undecaprenol N-acetylglucosamine transferase [Flavobacteriales bacterium]|tara:strand:- start:863 stop:2002 length:1140 start_codon:yes stop_codon:yes gene_type:complete